MCPKGGPSGPGTIKKYIAKHNSWKEKKTPLLIYHDAHLVLAIFAV